MTQSRRSFDEIPHAELSRQLADISDRIRQIQDLSWGSLALIEDKGTNKGHPVQLAEFLTTALRITLDISATIANDLDEVL